MSVCPPVCLFAFACRQFVFLCCLSVYVVVLVLVRLPGCHSRGPYLCQFLYCAFRLLCNVCLAYLVLDNLVGYVCGVLFVSVLILITGRVCCASMEASIFISKQVRLIAMCVSHVPEQSIFYSLRDTPPAHLREASCIIA